MSQRNAYSAISSGPRNPTGTVAVIIPTFNERDNLEPIVSRVRTAVPAADVLVVDDNSPDGTGEIAEVPVTFVDRARGQSKMSRSIVVEAFLRVAQWGIVARLGRIRPGQHASPRRVPSCRRSA